MSLARTHGGNKAQPLTRGGGAINAMAIETDRNCRSMAQPPDLSSETALPRRRGAEQAGDDEQRARRLRR
jgi:hypothetical protein